MKSTRSGIAIPLMLRLALRDLKGGFSGFRIFLACIALGVAAIASVSSLSRSLTEGISREGRRILGGDMAFSLIQREAGSEAEMPKIATVIYNRLADGERLGIDATSLYYAKQQGTDVDFSADTPYNTRTHDGLPPTPISTIDDAALRAALHPADGSWRYYVLVQKGKHLFTDDPDEFEKGRQLCIERDLGCG